MKRLSGFNTGWFREKRRIGYAAVFTLIVCFIGCASGPERPVGPVAGEQPEPKEAARSIDVVQKMRTQAVSSRVGRWAVVVGISDYKYDTAWNPKEGIPDLRYAARDAKAFADFLMSPAGGAFQPDHLRLLLDRQATAEEVRIAIGDFLARSLEDDLVILFFAGHGAPDPKNPQNLYLLCHDTQPGRYYGTALPMWEIDVALSRTIRSKKVIVIADACHSAGVGGTRAVSAAQRFNEYIDAIARSREGITKITASRANELSQERVFPEGGHGVFTYYLLKGLRGEADDNGDGFVTIKEAYAYLYDRVRSDTRHSQNPWASAYVSADIPLGITDGEVLDAIRARAGDGSIRPSASQPVYLPPAPEIDVPKDSALAVKLAQARVAKGDIGRAREILDTVADRHDAARPDALAAKIDLLLKENDLVGAENIEDRLVIPYPGHPAAKKGAGLILAYYLKQVEAAPEADQIQKLESYLKRHPEGPAVEEADTRLQDIRSAVRSRYVRLRGIGP